MTPRLVPVGAHVEALVSHLQPPRWTLCAGYGCLEKRSVLIMSNSYHRNPWTSRIIQRCSFFKHAHTSAVRKQKVPAVSFTCS
uniref:Uncharacterized protein n=1 Tax=Poecilia mexicana TaxID=48701 RepID=A0A3B3WM44_9TELE